MPELGVYVSPPGSSIALTRASRSAARPRPTGRRRRRGARCRSRRARRSRRVEAVEAADVRAEQRAVEPHAVPVDRAEVEQRRVAVGVGAPRVVEHRAVPRALNAARRPVVLTPRPERQLSIGNGTRSRAELAPEGRRRVGRGADLPEPLSDIQPSSGSARRLAAAARQLRPRVRPHALGAREPRRGVGRPRRRDVGPARRVAHRVLDHACRGERGEREGDSPHHLFASRI